MDFTIINKVNSIKRKVITLSSKRNINQYQIDQITYLLGQVRELSPSHHDKVCQNILIKPILKSIGYFN